MNFSRRRFLAISAVIGAGVALPYTADNSIQWEGRALGANAKIVLVGDETKASHVLTKVQDTITEIEALFSLHDPNSALSLLNRVGKIETSARFEELIDLVEEVHAHSGGLFDPTIQPLFETMARGKTPHYENIGWEKVARQPGYLQFLNDNMALTLNGIAQGFATDKIADILQKNGFKDIVVNLGEYRVGERSKPIGVALPTGQLIRSIELRNAAISTSSPEALRFSKHTSHIIRPYKELPKELWKNVTVIADRASYADGYSTALALTSDVNLAQKLVRDNRIQKAIFVDNSNKTIVISG